MTDNTTTIKTISRTDSGFPAYLDFNKLRADSIEYLGELAGKIWTDYNLHDPGITTIEILCYALLDLGYRTNFPAADIFASNPSETSPDTNFLTPSQLLTCNPLTITDYRKLLIDIDGVKNAWLEVARDIKDLCKQPGDPAVPENTIAFVNNPQSDCITYLNGLYHVYIELEEEKTDPAEKKRYEDEMIGKVRQALMDHRNLCEDFVDIYILCKLRVGICADIELENEADAATVYKALISALQDFMDPSPKFYTLQELLDKPKPIEDIFAGRPYNLTSSHGFTDTDELEALELKKEIHLSDLYALIGKIDGIRTVRRLQLQVCQHNKKISVSGWKYQLPKNNIPVFSADCSGIQFWQSGKSVTIDFNKFNRYLDLRFSSTGKILFTERYPYLDAAIPKGIYRKDIDDYYSIQHEYPRVYGIDEGGLPNDAPAKRVAQALQFKGYLLFFDQLLANYLVQLKNIRSLFSLGPAGTTSNPQTYFWQKPSSVPDLEKLLRFDNAGASGTGSMSGQGILATPVHKNTFLGALTLETVATATIEAATIPYYFISEAERDVAIAQLMEDFQDGNAEPVFITTTNADHYFYFESFADDWLILSKKYIDQASLQSDLSSLQYLATAGSNYRKNISADGSRYSFVVDAASSGYMGFLQQLSENKELYRKRRNAFLDHLLSRFAEQFTDFALLAFNKANTAKAEDSIIKGKEKFLSQYGELSSNRGKAYNYLGDPFSLTNVSGFENRVAALAGWNNCGSISLCNFVVEEFEEQFIIFVKFGSDIYFTSEDKFYSKEQAENAVQSLFRAAQSEYAYDIWHDKNEDVYRLQIRFGENKTAVFHGVSAASYETMQQVKTGLHRMFARKPVSDKVHTSQTVFRIMINNTGEELFTSGNHFADEKMAQEQYATIADALANPGYWNNVTADKKLPAKIYIDQRDAGTTRFIDLAAFKIDIDNTILGKPDKFSFEILDPGHHFRIESQDEFDSAAAAAAAAHQLLVDIAMSARYLLEENKEDSYLLTTANDDNIAAQRALLFSQGRNAQHAAKEITGYAANHLYVVSIKEKDFRFKYNFYLDSLQGDTWLFRSVEEYDEPRKAQDAAVAFYEDIPGITTSTGKGQLLLVKKDGIPLCAFAGHGELVENTEALKKIIDPLLDLKKKMMEVPLDAPAARYEEFVNNDILNKDQKFVYRLVDKDHLHAWYIPDEEQKESYTAASAKKLELFQDCHAYEHIEICLGGDIFRVRVDERTGQLWYHYQLRVNHPIFPGKEPVLFESVQGYSSEEEAQAAFDAYYVEIMNRAMKVENYDKGQYISIEEVLVHGNKLTNNKAVVFIANEIKESIHAYNDAQLVSELVAIAQKYPIRRITNDCTDREEWKKRFPCLPVPDAELINCNDCSCKNGQPIRTFYYYVLAGKLGNEAWQSVCYFDTAAEALIRFHFFLPLLCYPGNYFVNINPCNCVEDAKYNCKCKWEIYIREVLAESSNRYESKPQAWTAVEEFICVTQSTGAFHRYFDRKRCSLSFFVACITGGWIHPCRYASEKKRNHVLERLFRAAKDYFSSGHISFFSTANLFTVYDVEGNELGQFPDDAQTDLAGLCSRFTRLAASIRSGNEFVEKDEGYYLLDNNGDTVVARAVKDIAFEKWQEELKEAAYYFPVTKSTDKNGKASYCVEVKLPHFNNRHNDEPQECGCGNKPVKTHGDCWVAWKSDCCFASCTAALEFYFAGIEQLTDYHHYRPVFECDCGGYGIELIPASAIIAVNPQRYPTVKAVCEAVDRAQCLINCEGLHLVEHILLRPRCLEDCDCDWLQKNCGNKTGCNEFKWKNGDQKDVCNNEKEICFLPGADPYSFIATIVLPGWTARMRKRENQLIIEDLLYREAPAHVLLRILWLRPKDLWLFEAHYKRWEYWLGWNQFCEPGYSECEFLRFLFEMPFECLPACTSCKPCSEDIPVSSCFTDVCDELVDPGPNAFLNQVSELFCWPGVVCDEQAVMNTAAAPDMLESMAAVDTTVPGCGAPAAVKKAVAKPKRETALPKKKTAREKISISEEDIERRIDERFTRYRDNVQQLIDSGAKKTNAGSVLSFLQGKPRVEDFCDLLRSILDNKNPEGRGKVAYTKPQQRVLISNASYYFFDNAVFSDAKTKSSKELVSLFNELRQHKLLPDTNGWKEKEVKVIKPGASLKEIYKFLK